MKRETLTRTFAAGFALLLAVGLASTAAADQASDVVAIVQAGMQKYGLKAAIVSVRIDGKEVVTKALGESMTGVPATPDMHFRTGSVAFSYMTTILLQFVDEKKVSLDDKLSKWLPDLPHADEVTVGELTNMTSGYADYVIDPEMIKENYANPFRMWTPDEIIKFGIAKPLLFEPGTNWAYSHTGYVILGSVLEKIGGKPLADLMQERIFKPLDLTETGISVTAEMKEPVLHAFSSERRNYVGIPAGAKFYEEATYWNPSWTTTPGSVQNSNIYDLIKTAEGIGGGKLLSPGSYRLQTDHRLDGFGMKTADCPTCATLTRPRGYGMGVFLQNSGIQQSPLYGGYSAAEGYLPSRKIAVAVAVTYTEDGFEANGDYDGNASADLFTEIGKYLAPDDAP